jgi:hypothetical protein
VVADAGVGQDGKVTESPAVPAPAPARRRGTGRDMLISLGVLLVPVLIAVGVWQYLGSDHRVNTVDPAPVVAQARQAGKFTVAAPSGLPKGWQPTSAANAVDGGTLTLRIGYVTPSGGFAQLIESNQDSGTLIPANLPKAAQPSGTETVANQPWSEYSSDKGRALALLQPSRTILIIAQAPASELTALAASLHA